MPSFSLPVGPNPFTQADYDRALPDDKDHPVVNPRTTWQGPGIRCGQMVLAPGTSVYGIRPCLGVTTKVKGALRHFDYPQNADGTIDWSARKVGR